MMTFLSISNQAHAFVIMDTGHPQRLTPGAWLYGDPDSFQWVAAQFTIDQAYTLNGIQGWMASTGGSFTMSIYGNGNNLPDDNNLLHRQQFQIPVDATGADWWGVSGVNWNLNPGTYWVAFEVRYKDGDTYEGWMPGGLSNPPPHPADRYAICNDDSCWYRGYANFGLRINGEPVVPEPSTMLLFGAGALAAFIRRKVRS